MPFLMVSCVRRCICSQHLGIMFPRVWFVVFAALFMAASRLLVLGFSALHLWSELLFLAASNQDLMLFVHTFSRGRTLLLLDVDDMIITGDDPEYIAFVKAHLS